MACISLFALFTNCDVLPWSTPVFAVHIHTGMTCTADAGGHYYTGSVTADPWTSVVYTSDSAGLTSGSLTVTTGGSSGEVAGRAMIIHAHDGSRIGCAILGAATQVRLTASDFAPYYSYSGSLAVSGTVGPMTTVGTTQTFYWSLSGVDPACSSGPDTSKANSCGSESHDLDVAPSDALVACVALCLLALCLCTFTHAPSLCPARCPCAQSISTLVRAACRMPAVTTTRAP